MAVSRLLSLQLFLFLSSSLLPQLAHDACFYKWYQDEFLKGRARDEQPCDELFETYRSCLKVKMEKLGAGHLMDTRLRDELKQEEKKHDGK